MPTRYYVPPSDIRMDLLEPSETRTSCPYKGDAVHHHARIGSARIEDVAWSYPDPIPECPKVKGLVCFFNERVDDILIDGKPVEKIRTKWSRRSEEHTSELQSLMRISYAVFCLK